MNLSEHEAFSGVPHLTREDAASILKAVSKYDSQVRLALERGDVAAAINKAFSSQWSNLSKAVSGGLQFIVAADNGAAYAELWSSGRGADANWYAVTGAGIHQVDDIKKGMPVREAFDRFLAATVAKADCKPCGQK